MNIRLVKAKHLAHIPKFHARIARGTCGITYHHVPLEEHQMFIANGVTAEIMFLRQMSLRTLKRHAVTGKEL